tara:strand:+ start:100 stop:297 length:198 start_codon:yes stop_codon:yes gene_type:complete
MQSLIISSRRKHKMDTYDILNKMKSVGAAEGWTDRTQLIVLCDFISGFKQKLLLDEFLESRRETE